MLSVEFAKVPCIGPGILQLDTDISKLDLKAKNNVGDYAPKAKMGIEMPFNGSNNSKGSFEHILGIAFETVYDDIA